MIEILLSNAEMIWTIVSSIIALASIAIKFLPQLPEDHWAKPVLKFVGKNLALNRTSDGKISISIKTE